MDGLTVEIDRRPAFLWVKRGNPRVCGAVRREGRVLYRRVKKAYEYAGYTHALCGGCGVYHERGSEHVTECKLCGGKLAITN